MTSKFSDGIQSSSTASKRLPDNDDHAAAPIDAGDERGAALTNACSLSRGVRTSSAIVVWQHLCAIRWPARALARAAYEIAFKGRTHLCCGPDQLEGALLTLAFTAATRCRRRHDAITVDNNDMNPSGLPSGKFASIPPP